MSGTATDRARLLEQEVEHLRAVAHFVECLDLNDLQARAANEIEHSTLRCLGEALRDAVALRVRGYVGCSAMEHEGVVAVGEAQACLDEDDPRWYPYCEECCDIFETARLTPVRRWDEPAETKLKGEPPFRDWEPLPRDPPRVPWFVRPSLWLKERLFGSLRG